MHCFFGQTKSNVSFDCQGNVIANNRTQSGARAIQIYSGGESQTTTTSTTTTTQGECALSGDYPPCGYISLDEVVNHINEWAMGNADLSGVINLINAWSNKG